MNEFLSIIIFKLFQILKSDQILIISKMATQNLLNVFNIVSILLLRVQYL